MDVKKNKKVDLRAKQGLFFQIGMVVALGLVFYAFQWSVAEQEVQELSGVAIDDYVVELPPITRPEQQKKEEAPKPVATMEIVDDSDELFDDEEFDVGDVEADQSTIVIPVDLGGEEDDDEVVEFFKVEKKPEFPGGESALLRFLGKNTNYPEVAAQNGIQGKVYVRFVIDKEGRVTNVQLARGVDALLDKEALRVVSSMPNWEPGLQRNQPVSVAYSVPINFKLN